ncbi:Cof-type HAD-IIB family hydrolase [Fusibacter bizertensis]|uniref:Cof-type HAD-IIB family hydrolase n=1 Tax=Fusibacter bizertensis TaxID=1488331 RepID=A0ABT6N9W3_9FIRM|nr:Cof-type HAD-IIB family hydrolase [Fusibacter bizertensis]MDH8677201.1 Cof-type HAD-IIB family hydrolase [Fusibacter bizertensis]
MKKKLIVSDIDGTLLMSNKHISEVTKKRIFDLIDAGHIFAIATGRMHGAGKIITQELDYDGFLISCNGAVVKHLKTGEVIQAIELKPGLAQMVSEVCEKYGAYYHLYDMDTIYANSNRNLAKKFSDGMPALPEAFKFNVVFPESLPALIGKMPIYKIGLFHEKPEVFEAIMAELKLIDGLETCKSLETSFDVMAKGVSKATGIEALQKYFDVPLEDVIAFGDNENDMDMITYAGVGVAMSNAMEALKEVADFVTVSNDEDGLVYALDRLLH